MLVAFLTTEGASARGQEGERARGSRGSQHGTIDIIHTLSLYMYPLNRYSPPPPPTHTHTLHIQGDYVRVYPTSDPIKAKLYTSLMHASSKISLLGTHHSNVQMDVTVYCDRNEGSLISHTGWSGGGSRKGLFSASVQRMKVWCNQLNRGSPFNV